MHCEQPPRRLCDGVVLLGRFTDEDAASNVAGEDEETARCLGWWPQRSTEATFRAALAEWDDSWRSNGPRRTFAVRTASADRLLGGCELQIQATASQATSPTGRMPITEEAATRRVR